VRQAAPQALIHAWRRRGGGRSSPETSLCCLRRRRVECTAFPFGSRARWALRGSAGVVRSSRKVHLDIFVA